MSQSFRIVAILAVAFAFIAPASAQWITVDFEDVDLNVDGYYNGSDSSGQFTSRSATLLNSYNSLYGSWNGFAASNVQDVVDGSYLNQYASYADLDGSPAGGGYGGQGQYAVGYVSAYLDAGQSFALPTIELPVQTTVLGTYVTNTTYSALTMLNGGFGATPFGGPDGTDPDWLLLTVTGYDIHGNVSAQVTFDLADFSNPDGTDLLVDEWTWLNLQPLGQVKSLTFDVTGSDVGEFGLNTPSYFAIDNLIYDGSDVPEPSVAALLAIGTGAVLRRRRRNR
ncbi:MAG: DUF4465 domain-containing protein [Phycisphaerae bacterium]